MSPNHLLRCWALLIPLALLASTLQAADAPPFKYENTPENLQALMELLHRTVHIKKDTDAAAALFLATIPDEERAKAAMKDDVAAEHKAVILKMHSGLRDAATAKPEGIKSLFKPEQTVIKVHGATTEEIIKYEKGSVAYNEFPGGTRRVAELVLRPKTTYFEVEFLEPGQESGMKYHLYYWDGKQWAALGPVWRVLKQLAP